MGKRFLTTEQFVNKAIVIHGTKYEYNRVVYKRATEKVKIWCRTHGEFLVTPSNHLSRKSGCPECARNIYGKSKRDTARSTFVGDCNRIHNNKYGYSEVNYVTAHTKVAIHCPHHGTFEMQPYNHRQGQGCPECGLARRSILRTSNTSSFVARSRAAHGMKYVYDYVDYVKTKEKVQIVCREHGPFFQRPEQHLRGEGCPTCGQASWFAEQGGYTERMFSANPDMKSQSGLLYLIRFTDDNESFVKIGITKRTLTERFHWGYGAYQMETVRALNMPLYNAWKKEQQIITRFYTHRHIPSNTIGGWTECFDVVVVDDIIRVMN